MTQVALLSMLSLHKCKPLLVINIISRQPPTFGLPGESLAFTAVNKKKRNLLS